ncbi:MULTISPECIES: PAAR domain-containing protein [Burkholderia]|uniref:PAAR domain-containing protein n=1 Tax=Burkholderia TaxID=32008 RepID=UPI0009F21A4B|nr:MULTISPECIES: PAAR domain-containing protein [Burkholderia]EKS9915566.1 PAAR domain-containing protein [Burkholderia multivorans]MBU9184689.1 PAAR domain-containing protein [Burkholderia multivorans]MBU9368937.1 PAAR domain-containing protein [Burkholderia multivorans]MBU9412687.1 PAAR domain-containing protein [Burkholderia multivorans]MCA8481979.1 PAAR domain-containing protein [Burkholderia multivorans]
MRGVIRVGDSTDHGCQVKTGSERSVVMGRSVARVGDRCTCQVGLGECEILEGDKGIQIDGRAVAFDGHRTSCGAALISSIPTSGRT